MKDAFDQELVKGDQVIFNLSGHLQKGSIVEVGTRQTIRVHESQATKEFYKTNDWVCPKAGMKKYPEEYVVIVHERSLTTTANSRIVAKIS